MEPVREELDGNINSVADIYYPLVTDQYKTDILAPKIKQLPIKIFSDIKDILKSELLND